MKIKETKIAGAILAGGKNSRMNGKNKSFIDVNGTPIIERTVRLFEKIFEEVILVTNSPADYKGYARRAIIIEDEIKDVGPLGGIHAALSATAKDAVFFVACDMPFLHNGLILRQLDYFKGIKCDCLVPRIGNLVEPLHAIYRKKLKNDISDFLKIGDSSAIKYFFRTINTFYLDLDPSPINQRAFQNLNTQNDLEKLEESLWK